MRLAVLALFALLATVYPAVAEEEPDSPHRVLKPDGEADSGKCQICHQEDMSLAQPKAELCKMCHLPTIHAGAAEHLQATPAQVTQLLSAKKDEQPELPLTEEGAIFCGTCHIFHDPRVNGEEYVSQRWLPPSTGLPQVVREGLTSHWSRVAGKYGESESGAKFSARGTRALRLPVSDGSLCRRCHGTLP
jgi:hypothetical protein